MNPQHRNLKNPWPRMTLAALLTVWAGANLWSCVFRWSEIMGPDHANRTVGIVAGILFTLLPLVIAIFLFWTVVVGPDDPVATAQGPRAKKSRTQESRARKTGKRRNT